MHRPHCVGVVIATIALVVCTRVARAEDPAQALRDLKSRLEEAAERNRPLNRAYRFSVNGEEKAAIGCFREGEVAAFEIRIKDVGAIRGVIDDVSIVVQSEEDLVRIPWGVDVWQTGATRLSQAVAPLATEWGVELRREVPVVPYAQITLRPDDDGMVVLGGAVGVGTSAADLVDGATVLPEVPGLLSIERKGQTTRFHAEDASIAADSGVTSDGKKSWVLAEISASTSPARWRQSIAAWLASARERRADEKDLVESQARVMSKVHLAWALRLLAHHALITSDRSARVAEAIVPALLSSLALQEWLHSAVDTQRSTIPDAQAEQPEWKDDMAVYLAARLGHDAGDVVRGLVKEGKMNAHVGASLEKALAQSTLRTMQVIVREMADQKDEAAPK